MSKISGHAFIFWGQLCVIYQNFRPAGNSFKVKQSHTNLCQGMNLAAKGGILLVFGCASARKGCELFPEMIFRSKLG